MYIRSLRCGAIRSWESATVADCGQWNVFSGNNGAGKTSLLEALWLLHRMRTARGNRSATLIQTDTQQSRAFVQLEATLDQAPAMVDQLSDDSAHVLHQINLVLNLNGTTLSCELDGDAIARNLLSRMVPMVLMQPHDIQLLLGSSEPRREILQRIAFQQDPEFLVQTQKYERLLQQRNAVLKERKKGRFIRPSEMQIWDDALAKQAVLLRRQLASIFSDFAPVATEILSQLFPDIAVEPLMFFSDSERGIGVDEINEFVSSQTPQDFREKLDKTFEKDCRNGYTSLGPHRLDWNIFFGGLKAKYGASQGQIRSAALAIRMAQAMQMHTLGKEKPVVLVDDLAGELDEIRGSFLLQWLRHKDYQVWLTATSLDQLPAVLGSFEMRHWQVQHNQLIPS